MFNRAKAGKATPQQVFDYYLGWLTDPSITKHFQLDPRRRRRVCAGVGDEDRDRGPAPRRQLAPSGAAARSWSGGHSLGGSITTAYATWDFNGKPGAQGTRRARLHRRRQRPDADQRRRRPRRRWPTLRDGGSPWLTFGGIPSPFTGLFNTAGSLGALIAPNEAVARLGLAAAARRTSSRRSCPPTWPSTATRSTPRPRRRRWPRPRPTSAGSPRAARRAAGSRAGEHHARSAASPRCSPGGA